MLTGFSVKTFIFVVAVYLSFMTVMLPKGRSKWRSTKKVSRQQPTSSSSSGRRRPFPSNYGCDMLCPPRFPGSGGLAGVSPSKGQITVAPPLHGTVSLQNFVSLSVQWWKRGCQVVERRCLGVAC